MSALVLDGDKWWTSGAMDPRCQLAIFLGRSGGQAKHAQHSMVLVPMDAPGVEVVRPLPVFGYEDAPHGHAEVRFRSVRVPKSSVLLGLGRGFEMAQGRLGPGRLHHCMRLIGAGERALELMLLRSLSRSVFGKHIAEQGGFQQRYASARIELDGARLLVLRAADALDRHGFKGARGQIAAAKVAAPKAALAAIDEAIQVHGGAGVSGAHPACSCGRCGRLSDPMVFFSPAEDTPLAYLWAAARTLRIADGPDEVHLETVAKVDLGRARAKL